MDGGGSLGHDAPANRARRGGIWEIDFFYASSIINDKKERPYFPYVSLVVDHDSAFIFDFHLEKKVVCKSTFPMKFADFIERTEVIPDELLVNIHGSTIVFNSHSYSSFKILIFIHPLLWGINGSSLSRLNLGNKISKITILDFATP